MINPILILTIIIILVFAVIVLQSKSEMHRVQAIEFEKRCEKLEGRIIFLCKANELFENENGNMKDVLLNIREDMRRLKEGV